MKLRRVFSEKMTNGELERSWLLRYERWATVYEEEHRIAGWSEQGLSRRLAMVLELICKTVWKPASLILDLGAGPGTYTRAINQIGHRCVGLDYSRKVLEAAKKKGAKESYVQGEAYRLPFRNGIFDAVVCIGVLQSLEQQETALEEMRRVLGPGGQLFLDGLNSLFWMHNLRHWKHAIKGEKKRMSFYNPYHIQEQAERLGFLEVRLHWLAVPAFFQVWVNRSCKANSRLVSRLAGHAFLIEARKTMGGQE